ncbi:MAG: hypothetical protein LBB53_00820 [Prevotellaceae bacterium]|nr:hypothetical protein [Prevotellaceae bacterium]
MYNAGTIGYYWSSTYLNTDNAYIRYFNSSHMNAGNYYNSKPMGFSVRCVSEF